MYNLHLHKDAQKAIRKFPKPIRAKTFEALEVLRNSGTKDFPLPIRLLQGKFRKFRYFEIKIARDYRIIFRKEENEFFIRHAGTHNSLGTG
jgi:mRNA-degrading endonuclease RelE of RelBE toxin-antitoxin system